LQTNGEKIEYRVWNPFRSKLAAAVLGGVEQIHMPPGSKVLYLGAASGTTVSHVAADVVPSEDEVAAVAVEAEVAAAEDVVVAPEASRAVKPSPSKRIVTRESSLPAARRTPWSPGTLYPDPRSTARSASPLRFVFSSVFIFDPSLNPNPRLMMRLCAGVQNMASCGHEQPWRPPVAVCTPGAREAVAGAPRSA